MKTTAFWDASALAPLCVHEAASRHAEMYLRKFAPVVWWGSLVEVHSAICRLHREKAISDSSRQGAFSRLRLLSRSWREVLPDDELREIATLALDKYALRAADGLQLAAALVWCQQRPAKRDFICGDQRLADAAGGEGFAVVKIFPGTI